MTATIITFQKALKAYKKLKLGSFVKKGVNKSETNFKSAISILQVHDIGVNDEPTNATAVSTLTNIYICSIFIYLLDMN